MQMKADSHGSPGGREWRHRLRGLYAVTPDMDDTVQLTRRVEEAISGGARIVQYRNKSAPSSLRQEQARVLAVVCRNAGVPFVVNDDVELARSVGAEGVHLGRDDAALGAARAVLGPDALIGVSCYDDLARARDAEQGGASYVAFGSFFPSEVKPGAVRPPLALLRRARVALDLPIVAIGGITADNAALLIESGADAVAVISALFHTADTRAAACAFGHALGRAQHELNQTSMP